MDEETIQRVLKQVEQMLRDSTIEIESSAGILMRPNYDTGYMEGERTGGRTLTLKVQGGGGVKHESADASAWRLMREMREAE